MAVNHLVVGSNPTRGVFFVERQIMDKKKIKEILESKDPIEIENYFNEFEGDTRKQAILIKLFPEVLATKGRLYNQIWPLFYVIFRENPKLLTQEIYDSIFSSLVREDMIRLNHSLANKKNLENARKYDDKIVIKMILSIKPELEK